jgi:two-component system sensor histidine kinase PilS (NtrC family)
VNHAGGVPPRLSRFNALRGLADLWGAAEPAEFHWRLLRYFCWTQA